MTTQSRPTLLVECDEHRLFKLDDNKYVLEELSSDAMGNPSWHVKWKAAHEVCSVREAIATMGPLVEAAKKSPAPASEAIVVECNASSVAFLLPWLTFALGLLIGLVIYAVRSHA